MKLVAKTKSPVRLYTPEECSIGEIYERTGVYYLCVQNFQHPSVSRGRVLITLAGTSAGYRTTADEGFIYIEGAELHIL